MPELGHTYDVQPIPPDPASTDYLDVGTLRLGVEYRRLDPEALRDHYSGDDLEEVEENSPEGGFTDEGLSIHVDSVADDHEYLRFDVFDDDPHYHYVDKAAGTNTVIAFDRAANGAMLPWVLRQLAERVGPMLEAAGASHVAADLGPEAGAELVGALRSHLETIGIDADPEA